jgi:ADP-ribose pyrophosphatase YjhB (NUDIX family)
MKQALYLIADEIRGMASLSNYFAANVYEVERAHRLMELAAKVAALVDEGTPEAVGAVFDAEPWRRFSPAVGVDAVVLNGSGEILLVQRKDNEHWAMPGGIAEIGETPAEAVLRELWEEAGLRGQVLRLLALFDGRQWGSRSKVHILHLVFLVECQDIVPVPGLEMLDARFFAADRLPQAMHRGHDVRVPKCLQLLHSGTTFFDPASSEHIDMPMYQRPTD